MTKKKCDEHTLYCRAAELGIDLNNKATLFNCSQLSIIRESLQSEYYDSYVVNLYAKPEIKAAIMAEFYYALKRNMCVGNFETLYKFINTPAQVISRIRNLLEDNLVNQKILDNIFFDGEKYVFYCRYDSVNKYEFKDSAYSCLSYRKSGISKMLDAIRLIMDNSILRKLFLNYIKSNNQETIQNTLYLCSELTADQIADVLEVKISLELVKYYLAHNWSRKPWSGLIDFIGFHYRSADYVRAYLDNKIDEISKIDLLMFFELESNCLIDELFFEYGISFDSLRKLENSYFKSKTNRFGSLSSFNSYDHKLDKINGKITMLARSIEHWLNEGFPIELIRDYIDTSCDNNLAARILNIGFNYSVSPNDACIIANDRTLYLRMRKISPLLAQGFSIQNIKSSLKVDGRLKESAR